jgi:hypothetical protein
VTVSQWKEADSIKADEIWRRYQQEHDLSGLTGQTAGIDPTSGNVWFGPSIQEVVARRDAGGSAAALFFVRIGSAAYYRKGGRR